MSRYLLGMGMALLVVAGLFWWKGLARADRPLPPPPDAPSLLLTSRPLPEPPAAPERSREEKRFDRYDKDRDGTVTREEYLAARRKAYAKLDRDGDGRLDFDEWVVKTSDRFAKADSDRSATLSREEFATTRPKRKPRQTRPCPAGGGGDD